MTTVSVRNAADKTTPTRNRPSNVASRDVEKEIAFASSGERKIRLLVLSSLYPNTAQPRHGVFVEERLRHLVDSGRITATVVAPVPWFPFRHPMFGAYARFAAVPDTEERYGIQILHPRYPVIPKLGMNIAPSLMYRALLPVLRKLKAEGTGFDLIDAHYFYPDGVAAARLGAAMDIPVTITARGSDVTWMPRFRRPRQQIQSAAQSAAAIVTVSQSLKDALVALGVNPGKVSVLRNGVDLDRFALRDRMAIRAKLDLKGPVWLTVGNLVELKGVHIVVEALAQVPDATLLIAGDGPEEQGLRRLVERLGVSARVRFLGALLQETLCDYYNAADVMLLASSREGMPNVVLEALACGTPVVATSVGGIPEIISEPDAGELMQERTPEALVLAWNTLQMRKPDRGGTRAFARRLGWQPVIEAQCGLYARVLSTEAGSVSTGSAT